MYSMEDCMRIANEIENAKHKEQPVIEPAAHKKQCDEYAQKCVELLIEGKLRPQVFTRCLNFIDVSLYEDIVVERAIEKLCGYPLCGNQIPEMPPKKYLILSKVNKVYDITDRKNFCSNFCYKASSHIQEQIDDTPLWLRKGKEYPSYKLLENTNVGLTPGEEVVYGVVNPPDERMTSLSAFAAWLDDIEDLERPKEVDEETEVNEFEVVFESKQNVGKTILKKSATAENDETEEKPEKIKRVAFIDDCIEPISSGTSDPMKQQQEDLNESILSLCQSLNIKLELTNSNKNCDHSDIDAGIEQVEQVNIEIDLDKMNKVIEKVNESETQRKKKNVVLKPHVDEKLVAMKPPPKYSERFFDILNKTNPASTNIDVEQKASVTKKNTGKAATMQDDKMRQLINKLKAKNQTEGESKRAILINTVTNPELALNIAQDSAKKQLNQTSILGDNELLSIKNAFANWLTLDTFIYIYGENAIKHLLTEEKLAEYFDKLRIKDLEVSQQLKYVEICKKLHLKELADSKFDSACKMDESNRLKPLPNYQELKEVAKEMNLKVKAFYSGSVAIKEVNKNSINTRKQEGDDDQRNDREHQVGEEENGGDGDDKKAVLPLVDASSQNEMRRGVFNKSLAKFIHNHAMELSLGENITQKVQELVKTFKLEAHNIVFKPKQWNIIALILINCLRKADSALVMQLSLKSSTEYVERCFEESSAQSLLTETTQLINNVEDFVRSYIQTST